jgi:hypothetical protein
VAASGLELGPGGAVVLNPEACVPDADGGAKSCGVPGMAGAGAAGTTGATETGGVWGMYEGAGMGAAAPILSNEPIGGGAFETGGAGTGAGMNDPGSGGAVEALGGRAIWPISGTMLGAGAVRIGAAAMGLGPDAEEAGAVRSLKARLICTTASKHSVPIATAEERSRSEDRMVDGGVTSC